MPYLIWRDVEFPFHPWVDHKHENPTYEKSVFFLAYGYTPVQHKQRYSSFTDSQTSKTSDIKGEVHDSITINFLPNSANWHIDIISYTNIQ